MSVLKATTLKVGEIHASARDGKITCSATSPCVVAVGSVTTMAKIGAVQISSAS
ncbi:MAG: hypothetical protein ABSH29_17050 [Acidimicrobiales bacterium]